MTIRELTDRLAQYPHDMPVMILDGFNGGGAPRTINLGPCVHHVREDDADAAADCDDLVGAAVVVLGYGCY